MTVKIEIKEKIEKQHENCFENLNTAYVNNTTILYGDIKDQAALFGLITKIGFLNLPVTSIVTQQEYKIAN
jgi:hypothetical protein